MRKSGGYAYLAAGITTALVALMVLLPLGLVITTATLGSFDDVAEEHGNGGRPYAADARRYPTRYLLAARVDVWKQLPPFVSDAATDDDAAG